MCVCVCVWVIVYAYVFLFPLKKANFMKKMNTQKQSKKIYWFTIKELKN